MRGEPDQPGLDCVAGGHLSLDVEDEATGEVVGGWCLWCGSGAYDQDRMGEDGVTGFTPRFVVRVPDRFYRDPETSR